VDVFAVMMKAAKTSEILLKSAAYTVTTMTAPDFLKACF
jgi:hypothetical protein